MYFKQESSLIKVNFLTYLARIINFARRVSFKTVKITVK